jgi:hypothetical protein
MKQPTYREAVRYLEREGHLLMKVPTIASLILVGDLWGVPMERVAHDIMQVRRRAKQTKRKGSRTWFN